MYLALDRCYLPKSVGRSHEYLDLHSGLFFGDNFCSRERGRYLGTDMTHYNRLPRGPEGSDGSTPSTSLREAGGVSVKAP